MQLVKVSLYNLTFTLGRIPSNYPFSIEFYSAAGFCAKLICTTHNRTEEKLRSNVLCNKIWIFLQTDIGKGLKSRL